MGSRSPLARRTVAALALLAGVVVSVGAGALPPTGTAGAATPRYYVSLGDSYSIGYQPAPAPGATGGYTAVVAGGTGLTLANFGCAGATTSSVLDSIGCTPPDGPAAATGRVPYPHQTQVAAATGFIRQHRGQVGLITVSIGGNDVTQCVDASDPVTCVVSAVGQLQRNVATLAAQLRQAAGPSVPLIGLTYPDVLLGLWVRSPRPADMVAAGLSVPAFQHYFNPALATAYETAGGSLVDVTKDAGGYVPLTTTTTLPPYGTVPVAVARTCALTWYCAKGNIHATTAGYTLIGRAIVSQYRALHRP